MLDDAKIGAPAPKKSKKRKSEASPSDPAIKELREKAKFYCKNIHEWRVVSKYNQQKLQDYLSDQSFLNSAENYQQCSEIIANVYAFVVDKLSKGDGFVEAEIKNDISLRNSIQKEMVEILKTITNRLQIGLFSVIDVIHGKKRQSDASHHVGVGNSPNDHHANDRVQVVDEDRGTSFERQPDSASAPPWRGRDQDTQDEDLQGFNQSSAAHHDSAGQEGVWQDESID